MNGQTYDVIFGSVGIHSFRRSRRSLGPGAPSGAPHPDRWSPTWMPVCSIPLRSARRSPFSSYFESWIGPPGSDRYQQGAGQVDRLWILDVDGARVVIDAFSLPSAAPSDVEQLGRIVESIRFER